MFSPRKNAVFCLRQCKSSNKIRKHHPSPVLFVTDKHGSFIPAFIPTPSLLLGKSSESVYNVCSTVVQRLFNGCSMVVQRLFNGCTALHGLLHTVLKGCRTGCLNSISNILWRSWALFDIVTEASRRCHQEELSSQKFKESPYNKTSSRTFE